jgi:chaperonin cofactor prefoldin
MFRIPVEELLRRNGIRDASRLRVGTVLEIPDPRAVLVQELRSEQDGLRSTVQELRGSLEEQRARVGALEDELRRTAAERDALQGRLSLYAAVKVVTGIALLAVLALAGALLLAVARLRDESRRRLATLKHVESLRAAVERYRSLGGQLELKYHNLYRQSPSDQSTEAAAQALRATYDVERAGLEARIAESEAALAEIEKAPATRRRRHHKAA